MDLDGKVIVVTGSARGLGLAFAEGCAKLGAHVVMADILEEQGRIAAAELAERGLKASFMPIDLASPEAIGGFAAVLAGRFKAVDGLVNNGAIATGIGGKSFLEIDIATWDRVMEVNVRSVWLLTKALLPLMRLATAAKIVNVASDTALWGAPLVMHYVASKGAVIALTRTMATELGPDGIAVNAIAPSLTLVEATESVSAERHKLCIDHRAFKRPQMPVDNVGAVTFLLSDSAGFITGQTLAVNGGFLYH
jgi:NAD(P)-dependent dehydrogenase (short-subunit alcohol dehydrogenase family)